MHPFDMLRESISLLHNPVNDMQIYEMDKTAKELLIK
jgi:hypothetical protein